MSDYLNEFRQAAVREAEYTVWRMGLMAREPEQPLVETRNGIAIGCAYTPPPAPIDGHALTIQRALLAKPKKPLMQRLLDAICSVFP